VGGGTVQSKRHAYTAGFRTGYLSGQSLQLTFIANLRTDTLQARLGDFAAWHRAEIFQATPTPGAFVARLRTESNGSTWFTG
jgi:hypothetical protein